MAPGYVVVDGSNIATEGRSTPSLARLDEAVTQFQAEFPGNEIIVVVDATFGHRIDPSERAAFDEAVAHGEMVSPPAGAVGRGDAFLLRIAERVDALVLSNDSFQEFHAEHPWLFEEGRLIGGKPVSGVGWIFTPRNPVRGARSRAVLAGRPLRRDRGGATAGSGVDAGDGTRPAIGATKAAPPVRSASPTMAAPAQKPAKRANAAKAAKVADAVKAASAETAEAPAKAEKARGSSRAAKVAAAPKAAKAAEKAAKTKKAAKTATVAKAAKSEEAAKSKKAAKPGKAVKATTSEKAAKLEKAAATARPTKAAKAAKGSTKSASTTRVQGVTTERDAGDGAPSSDRASAARGSRRRRRGRRATGSAVRDAIDAATAEATTTDADADADTDTDAAAPQPTQPRKAPRRRSASPPAVNDPLTFLTFVSEHPIGSVVEGAVSSFVSHGAMVDVDGMQCYVPLAGLGSPPPRRAREVIERGKRVGFVLVALDPARRGAELALPALAAARLDH